MKQMTFSQYTSDDFVQHKMFWHKQFSLSENTFSFGPYLGKTAAEFNSKLYSKSISLKSRTLVAKLGNGDASSVFVAAISAMLVTISRYKGVDVITIAVPPLLDEPHAKHGALPLVFDLAGCTSMRSVLNYCGSIVKNSHGYQDYPFELIENGFGLSTPSTNIAVLSPIHCPLEGEMAFDFLVRFSPEFESIDIFYNEKYFSHEMAERFCIHFENVCTSFGSLDKNWKEIEILIEEELKNLTEVLNHDLAHYPSHKRIIDLFEDQVEKYGDRIAVLFDDNSISYEELNSRSNQLAYFLKQNEYVNPGDLVGISFKAPDLSIISILAVLKLNAAYVPIDITLPGERINFILDDTNLKTYLTESAVWKISLSTKVNYIELDLLWKQIEDTPQSNLLSVGTPHDLVYVIYTSGSTGMPKGVMIENGNVVSLLTSDRMPIHLHEELIWSQFHSYSFDFSVWEIFGALCFGGKMVTFSRYEVDEDILIKKIEREAVTILNLVPSVFANYVKPFIDKNAYQLNLTYLIFGGEALNPEMLYSWSQNYPLTKIVNMYGITETTVFVTYKLLGEKEILSTDSNIGLPLSNLNLHITNKHTELVPYGVDGELIVLGNGVARGYLNQPELTNNRFFKKWGLPAYRSGDIAVRLYNGDIKYLGRSDNQVKINGFRIELGEIESVIKSFDGVQACVVLVNEKATLPNLQSFIIGINEDKFDSLRQHIALSLPYYMIPQGFVSIKQFPLTDNGKIDRKYLFSLSERSESLKREGKSAEDQTVLQNLTQMCIELLRKNDVKSTENFFELGGNSLTATRLVSRIYKDFGVQLSLANIFTYPTMIGLSEFISTQAASLPEQIVPVRRSLDYPLSHSERRVWIKDQLGEGLSYNISSVWKFQGDVNHQALNKAFNQLIERHEILRTVFIISEGIPRQKILDTNECKFQVKLKDIVYSENEIRQSVNNLALEPFDLEIGPLMRAELINTEEFQYVFIFVISHIITDDWSMDIMQSELIILYNSILRSQASLLSKLPIQYKDYSVWHNSFISGDKRQAHVSYVKSKFSGELPRLDFPKTNMFDPASKKGNSKSLTFTFDSRLSEGMKMISKQKGSSMFMTVMALLKVLLFRYTGQSDIIIGAPISGRENIILENQLGFYLNTIPIRTQIDGELSFDRILENVKASTLQAYEHSNFPFDLLMEQLNLKGGGDQRLFDVLLVSATEDAYRKNSASFDGFSVEPIVLSSDSVSYNKFDLSLYFNEFDEEIQLTLAYNTDTFTDLQVSRLVDHLKSIASIALNGKDRPISEYDYLSEEEKENTVFKYNQTHTLYQSHALLHHRFEYMVSIQPHRICFHQGDFLLSYDEINKMANIIASWLLKLGIEKGDRIGLITERSADMIASLLGILKSGAIYVPLEPSYPTERQLYILTNAAVKAVVSDSDYEVLNLMPEVILLKLDLEDLSTFSESNPNISVSSTSPAYIIYTSGTTGFPKGVIVEHHSTINLIEWVNRTYSVSNEDKLLFITSVSFDLSVYDIFGALSAGASIVLANEDDVRNVEKLDNIVATHSVTFWNSVPTTLDLYLSYLGLTQHPVFRDSLRVIFLSGDWAPVALIGKIQTYFPGATLVVLGGATEGTVWSNYFEVNHHNNYWRSIPYGKPIANNSYYILDQKMLVVPTGVTGELYIGGVGIARGYVNDLDKTHFRFVKNIYGNNSEIMYRTGDIGRMLEDGNIEFLGRTDQQVKIRGYRVELGEIEFVLSKHKMINQIVVVGKLDSHNNKILVAYVVPHDHFDKESIIEFAATMLPNYMIPAVWMTLNTIPLTSNGKVDKKSLPDPFTVDVHHKNLKAPTNEVERQLQNIWQELIGISPIGISDNFFELGGHSLLTMNLMVAVRRAFSIQLTFMDVFHYPTIFSLANHIEKKKGEIALPPISNISYSNYHPLSFAQERMWIIDKLEGSIAYHIPSVLRLRGNVHTEAIKSALTYLLDKHVVLRTVFHEKEGDVYQYTLSPEKWHCEYVTYEDIGDPIKLEKYIDVEVNRPFDLSKDYLLRASLIELSKEEFLLVIIHHHIASDGTSQQIFFKQLGSLYMFFSGQDTKLIDIEPIQYAEYATWQRTVFSDNFLAEKIDYWREKLIDLPRLDLPLDFERPKIRDTRGASLTANIEGTLTRQLKTIAQNNGSTLFNLAVAAFKLILAKYSNQTDIAIGTVTSNRQYAETKNMIGFFANTIVLRTVLTSDNSFIDLMEEVKRNMSEALTNQDASFEKIVELLETKRDPSTTPLFQVMIQLQNSFDTQVVIPGIQVEILGATVSRSKFDLILSIIENPAGLSITLEYASALFKRETIEILLGNFTSLLQKISDNPGVLVADLLNIIEVPLNKWQKRIDNTKQSEFSIADKPEDSSGTEVLSLLVDSFAEVLNIKAAEISIFDDFFELGGNSMKAIKLVTKLQKHLKISMNDIFARPTISLLKNIVRLENDYLYHKSKLMVEDASDEPTLASYRKPQGDSGLLLDIPNLDQTVRYDSVLLFGATGYLGIHLLNKLLTSTESEIILMVRAENDQDAYNRLKAKYAFYFSNDIEIYHHRLVVMKADIGLAEFGCVSETYLTLLDKVDCVFNAAANVRHYGHLEEIQYVNTEGVRNLINFASKGRRKDIHHISTLSVAGINVKDRSNLFTEYDFDQGQTHPSYYSQTKFEAEKYLFAARLQGINTNIYRVGNLSFHSETGLFQENISDNAFYFKIRAFINMGVMPHNESPMEISSIDQVVAAISLLYNRPALTNQVFHIQNPNRISADQFSEFARLAGYRLSSVNLQEFQDSIQKNSAMEEDMLHRLMLHYGVLDIHDHSDHMGQVEISSQATDNLLHRLEFNWNKNDSKSIIKMLRYGESIGYFKKKNSVSHHF